MQQQQNASPMEDYMASYGTRLQSLLDGGSMPPSPQATPPAAGPGSALPPPGQTPTAPQAGGGFTNPNADGGGTSFRMKWNDQSEEQQQRATDDLEKQLKSGNQTIDSAYDQLVTQLGERPGPDNKLSREEKGMFLMEFGLSLMANSSGRAYGQDLGGAVGASGLQAMQSHRQRRQTERDRYDSNLLAINTRRADSKSDLAKQSALEARAESRDQRRTDRENGQVVGIVTQPDNSVVGYTRGGSASLLELPGGRGVQAKPKPVSTGGGAGGNRTLSEERRFNMYMDIYGKDGMGKPLQGEQLEAVKRRALQYSADPKGATLSDAEMRTMAERSADAFQKSNWAQFRDMKPDEIKKWRDKAAQETYERLRKGDEAALELPQPKPAATSALSPGSRRSFKSSDEIRSALASKEIKYGDTVMLNGKPFTIQKKKQ